MLCVFGGVGAYNKARAAGDPRPGAASRAAAVLLLDTLPAQGRGAAEPGTHVFLSVLRSADTHSD